jgi:uncharacterized membrane protein (DUF4010 family)
MYDSIVLLGVALAVGFLIGIERGWKQREAEEGTRISGLRTFGLIGLLGGVIGLLSQQLGELVFGFVFLGMVGVMTAAYVSNVRRTHDVGITSLIAGLLTFALGALAGLGYVAEAGAAAVITTLLLGFKPVLHGWLRRLQGEELRAGLKLLLISIVLLPVLPDRGYGPWEALNPYQIWWMVVLIAAISFSGYFAMRIAGTSKGAILTGLFAGLASSTALTLHFSRLARRKPDMVLALAPGILIACGTMYPRMLLVGTFISPQLFRLLLLPAGLMTLIIYGAALWQGWNRRDTAVEEPAPIGNPLELMAALRFGLLLAAIMLLAEALKDALGEVGILLLAAASGVADVDAITLSLARMTTHDAGMLQLATAGIIIASAVNSSVKAVLAFAVGGMPLGRKVVAPLVLAAATGLLAVWLLV